MKYNRSYNFSSGPAVMPEPVLEEIREELMNYKNKGMSVMEMSHRSDDYQEIATNMESDLRMLMNIPNNYKILFMQGGCTLQFSAIPLNLMKKRKAIYIDTGFWASRATEEARKYGSVIIAASSQSRNYNYVPDCSNLEIPLDLDYFYICENETIDGTTWETLPNTKGIALVSDQTSMFISKPCDVKKYGLIYAGVQKNVGPAGMAIVIVREDLIREEVPHETPLYLRYDIHAQTNSGYNTSNTWSVYCCGKVIQHIIQNGGLIEMEKRNREKAALIYDFLDFSRLFNNSVEKRFRSMMNIPFSTGDKNLDLQIASQAEKIGLKGLAGHPVNGGLRASIYNAMPKKGIEELIDFLSDVEKKHFH